VFDFVALDVALGLIFVYLVLSLICSAVSETISSVLAWRSDTLREGIENLLGDDDEQAKAAREKMFNHPVVAGLIRRKGGWLSRRKTLKKIPLIKNLPAINDVRYPSYLPARAFAIALLYPDAPATAEAGELEAKQGTPAAEARARALALEARTRVAAAIAGIDNQQTRQALTILWNNAGKDVKKFENGLERWFDDGMSRVSGWYRRRVQVVIWVLALVVTLAVHADSIQIAQALWKDDATRAAVVARTEQLAQQQEQREQQQVPTDPGAYLEEVDKLGIPLGWGSFPDSDGALDWLKIVLLNILGLGMTAVALTLGAPFWFDLLKKVANIRSAGKPPAEKPVAKPGEAGEPAAST
jgi:hypothetical protein